MDFNPFKEIKSIPPLLDHQHYASLNGFRAVSIILVVFSHLLVLYTSWGNDLAVIGPLGVNIFFVISGFLITTLCIKEKLKYNSLSLSNFYIRRILRIVPVAYLYVLFIFIINIICNLNISSINFVGAVLFLTNISYFGHLKFDWDLAHFWSLAVEEQFYLLLPFFIKTNIKYYTIVIIMLVFGVPALMYLQTILPFLRMDIITAFLRYAVKFQAIGVGCLFSIFLFNGYLNFGKYKFATTLFCILFITVLRYHANLIVFGQIRQSFDIPGCLSNLAVSILTGFLVINNISSQNNIVYKFLNWKVMNFIGILSYSIYVWQQVFTSNDPRFPLSKFPVNLAFLILVPVLSYFFYERLFLDLKKRFTRRQN